ncbi:hypothetical protein O7632_30990 [Solwaraspora sp. WMMD406]|uniref:hypothetical protein n=1 Tax=Solwaraspora sp. WMMD406 TaxID=3016095 RepID=UPI002415F38E|nr:hypothetical protein [Solwaraspora sp. WMMD406]MDG4768488.1 hypothetical protein [Solwaraspora sp. WMMD406]
MYDIRGKASLIPIRSFARLLMVESSRNSCTDRRGGSCSPSHVAAVVRIRLSVTTTVVSSWRDLLERVAID